MKGLKYEDHRACTQWSLEELGGEKEKISLEPIKYWKVKIKWEWRRCLCASILQAGIVFIHWANHSTYCMSVLLIIHLQKVNQWSNWEVVAHGPALYCPVITKPHSVSPLQSFCQALVHHFLCTPWELSFGSTQLWSFPFTGRPTNFLGDQNVHHTQRSPAVIKVCLNMNPCRSVLLLRFICRTKVAAPLSWSSCQIQNP